MPDTGGGGGGGTSRKRRSGNKGRPGGSGQPPSSGANARSQSQNRRRTGGGADFWGRPADGPPSDRTVRPTIDPGAVVRSLGDPPLGPNPATAAHHLTAIYEEAVRAATALAAANGLLEDQP
ncbi:MAG: hypothetical protein QOD57_4828 [Actinomycetota bacterium]|jgi:hypothetical protein|nr:hypothetical protein [Actinomycetota bacterium]MDQ1507101.1 hypothetical protein [Actinomycetota bacterium]